VKKPKTPKCLPENKVFIDDWERSGLKLPSVIRVHKIALWRKIWLKFL
jgi:hypothetical protein